MQSGWVQLIWQRGVGGEQRRARRAAAMFREGRLCEEGLSEALQELFGDALEEAVESRRNALRTGHILLACAAMPPLNATFAESLRGRSLGGLVQALRGLLYREASAPIPILNLLETEFTPPAREALRSFEALPLERQNPLNLLICTLQNLDREERLTLEQGLDIADALAYLRAANEAEAGEQEATIWNEQGVLRADLLDVACREALQAATRLAAQRGYERVYPLHLLLALAERAEGATSDALRLFAPPGAGMGRVLQVLERAIDLGGERRKEAIAWNAQGLATATQEVFQQAERLARSHRHSCIDEAHLFVSLVAFGDARLQNTLQNEPLYFDRERLLQFGRDKIAELDAQRPRKRREAQWIASLCPCQDLIRDAENSAPFVLVGRDKELEEIKRALYRRENRRVLLYGEGGAGKTAILKGLAAQMAAGEIPFLKTSPLAALDITEIRAEDAPEKIAAILNAADERPWCVYVIEEIDRLISADKEAFRAALAKTNFPLIGTLSAAAYFELLTGDAGLQRLFVPIEASEMSREEAIAVLEGRAKDLAESYAAPISREAIESAVSLSADFMLNERLPQKAISVLQQACDDARYDLHYGGAESGGEVARKHVVRQIARITRLPLELVEGGGADKNYKELLSAIVIGQEGAAERMAQRLTLIQKGMTDKKRPAAICLFAGLPGAGKTEMAKAIAKIYSESKDINLFPMGHLKESYSVAELLGAQPGTVGYESGGTLINALNRDPYGVFLFDEAEKAHPEVLDALLHLLEEGWVRDRRNVLAKANKAIIVMTTNAGASAIEKGLAAGLSMEAVSGTVRQALLDERRPETGARCFRPEFLSRIDDVILFKPLEEKDIIAIAALRLRELAEEWREERGVELTFAPSVGEWIGKLAHIENLRGERKLGGRAVREQIDFRIKSVLARRMADLLREKSGSFGVEDFAFPNSERG